MTTAARPGRELLRALKFSAVPDGPALCIPVGTPLRAVLRPVATTAGRLNAQDVSRLTHWRNRFVHAFLTEFVATEGRTARWLVEHVGPSERKILFMLDDSNGRTFGYMGLDFLDWDGLSGEADAIVRGADAPPGLMSEALRTLLAWAQCQLGLRRLGVRVRSDNSALLFYRKLGFRELRSVPLRKVETKDSIAWVEDSSLEAEGLSLVHMRLPADHEVFIHASEKGGHRDDHN